MTTTELHKLKHAIREINAPYHTLYIKGKSFKCEWTGNKFEWTAASGTVYTATASEVIQWIGDGNFIESYTYDYNDEPDPDPM